MLVVQGYTHIPEAARHGVLAIGNFDGVHRGHQALLARAEAVAGAAPAGPAGVMIFDPHPRALFQPDVVHFQLTPHADKLALLEAYGADVTIVLAFDRALAALTAEQFIDAVLVQALAVRHVIVGYDFHFGKARGGSPETLVAAGQAHGFGVTIVAPVTDAGAAISSTSVRQALASGRVEAAALLLGRSWSVAGVVTGGAKRGTGMGYPTANITLPAGVALGHGIYAVRVHVGTDVHDGAAYLGTRPTFDNGAPVLETFLLDFDGDLYGKRIAIEFIAHIRGDQKFDGMPELIAQMDRDVAEVRRRLALC
jgi:riboflavin kinase / FMN adenylyltransferase